MNAVSQPLRSVALGCGHYLPAQVVTNEDLSRILDTSDEWIRSRSGIRSRRRVSEGETTAHLAVQASRMALEDAGIEASDLDLIVLATTTPDQTFPATATRIQSELGMKDGFAFDLQAVCCGFLYALAAADGHIRCGRSRRALVIGAETFSRLLDWSDRSTAVLFGDGAGAVVLGAEEGSDSTPRGLLAIRLRSDGTHGDLLYVDGGVATGNIGHVRMNGREVFRHAVRNLTSISEEVLEEAGIGVEEVDWLVPHQANIRIIQSAAKAVGMPSEKIITTIAEHGNTSAASVPLALSTAVHDGRIRRGDLILTEAMGGGLTWGAALLRW